jgi:hypothetical protein
VPPAGPRFPVPGPRFPVPAESGSGIPSPFPGQIGNRGNGNWGLPGLVVILHRPVLGSLRRTRRAGGGQNLHLRGLMQHPAQDHGCCAHTRRVSPISRFAANRETGDFPIPDSESEIGDSLPGVSFPAKSEKGGPEIADFRAYELSTTFDPSIPSLGRGARWHGDCTQ